MKRKHLITLLMLYLLASPLLQGQQISKHLNLNDTSQVHFVETLRGDRFIGRVIHILESSIVFQISIQNDINFDFKEILKVGVVGIDFGEELTNLLEDRGLENLYYSPTAFGFNGGGEYRNMEGLWNTVEFGLGDNLSITAGFVIPYIVVLRTKIVGKVADNLRIGLGGTTAIAFFDGENSALFHVYSIVTIGSERAHINFTGGILTGDIDDGGLPLLTFGGSFLFGQYSRFYFDLYFLHEGGSSYFLPTVMYSSLKKRNKFDIGITIIPQADPPVFPVLSYARIF